MIFLHNGAGIRYGYTPCDKANMHRHLTFGSFQASKPLNSFGWGFLADIDERKTYLPFKWLNKRMHGVGESTRGFQSRRGA